MDYMMILGTIWAVIISGASFYIAHTETRNTLFYKVVEFLALNYGKAKNPFVDDKTETKESETK